MTGLVAGRYTRVTVVGSRRRVDVVLPSEETVGRLLPELLHLIGDPPGTPAELRQLVSLDGTLLDEDRSLAEAGVIDGSMIRVVGSSDAPPAPVVHDVTEVVVDDLDGRAWLWGDEPRRWTLTAAIVAALVTGLALLGVTLPDSSRTALLGIAAATLLLGGGVLARVVHRAAGTALLLGGGAVGAYAALTSAAETSVAVWVTLAEAALLAIALGVCTALGRGGVIGGGVGLALLVAWAATSWLELSFAQAGAVLALLSAVVLGLLPRLALVTSGLSVLDDRRSRDETVRRPAVVLAMTAAHRGLTLATVAVAVSAGGAGWLLLTTTNRWTVPLAVLLLVVLATRARAFPLVGQVLSVAAAAAAVLTALLTAWLQSDPEARPSVVAVIAGALALSLGALAVRPAEHVMARIRRIADRVEAATVMAMVPVTVGVFGLYGYLLESF